MNESTRLAVADERHLGKEGIKDVKQQFDLLNTGGVIHVFA